MRDEACETSVAPEHDEQQSTPPVPEQQTPAPEAVAEQAVAEQAVAEQAVAEQLAAEQPAAAEPVAEPAVAREVQAADAGTPAEGPVEAHADADAHAPADDGGHVDHADHADHAEHADHAHAAPLHRDQAPPVPVSAEEQAERLARLPQMLDGAEQILSATDLPDARTRWNALRRDWTTLLAGVTVDEATSARLKSIEARIDVRELRLREARSRQQHENLLRLQSLCAQLEKAAAGEHLTLRDAERALREARAALDAPGPLPSRQDQQGIVARLKGVQSSLFPRVQDLREADEWERWANAGVQDSLIRKLEALREEADVAMVARQLRQVQDEWHKVRAVPREKGRELWQRYKTVEAEIRVRCESFFQQAAVERTDNLLLKEALCAQVEGLADSTDWIRTAETIKGLQAQWKTVGPVTPGHEKAIWERFRAACDRFFTRRKQDLGERKAVWTVNLQKKEAICAQIEALAETTDWEQATAEVKRLQIDWRGVGPVKRTRADALLLRFRSAYERFFERYAHRHDHEAAEQAAAREQLCVDLEALAAGGGEPQAPEALAAHVMGVKRQWDQSAAASRGQSETLQERFTKALIAVVGVHAEAFTGTELDPEATRKRMEQLCQMVESAAGDEQPGAQQLSPAAILAARLREALAANTIGGRVDDEARWRNAAEEVRKAQASWRRLGPVPDAIGKALEERFQRVCNRVLRQRDARRPAPGPGRP